MSFFDALKTRAERVGSWVCIGLDPTREHMPAHMRTGSGALSRFLLPIIAATLDVACCYKPNLAFYLAEGAEGMQALEDVREAIPTDIPVILDAKAGDIGSTAAAYARAAFDTWGFDAITVNPFVGDEAVLPFAKYAEKGVYVLARTSNPNSSRFQSHHELWRKVIEAAQGWNDNGNIGLVVGATNPTDLRLMRRMAPDLPFLIPGIGAQGGDLAAAVQSGATSSGIPAAITSSRAIIYASSGEDFAEAARQATIRLRDQIHALLEGE